MKLITAEILTRLKANRVDTDWALKSNEPEPDHKPVLKLFTPDGAATWLLTEIEQDGDTLFGLCDLGMGEPELGYVSLSELQSVRGGLGLPVERDMYFKATKTLSQYAEEARVVGRIVA